MGIMLSGHPLYKPYVTWHSPDRYEKNYPVIDWKIQEEKLTTTDVNNEKLTLVTRYSDIKPGDVLEISRRITVQRSDKFDGVKSKDNRVYRLANASDGYFGDLPAFTMKKVGKALPDNWPPEQGDIWEAEGHEYHAQTSNFSSGKLLLRPADPYNNSNLSIEQLKVKNPVLKYRKGAL